MDRPRPSSLLLACALCAGLGAQACTRDATGGNLPPRAVAGPDFSAMADEAILLDGRGSSDPDGDALTFAWAVVAAPADALFDLQAPAEAMTVFVPRTRGAYLVRLRVEDGHGASDQDVLQVLVAAECSGDAGCDDFVGCTQDACVAGECTHTPDPGACPDDGLHCTGVESCDALAGCVSSGDPCASRGLTCDEALDSCTGCAEDADCDDQVACTTDACTAGTCANTPDPAQCPDDGQFCNGAESCDALQGCVHGGDPCLAQSLACDEGLDQCVACTSDGQCGDFDPCTIDRCVQGACEHEPVVCDDGVGCTDDQCVDGGCQHSPNDLNCADDGVFCNGAEVCDPSLGCRSTGDPCAGGAECAASCDEARELCADPLDTACGDPSASLPCDAADACDGDGRCDPRHASAGTFCPDTQSGDCWRAACDGQGACSQTYAPQPQGTSCRVSVGECDPAELCTGAGGPCPGDVLALNGTPCYGGDGEQCNSTCQDGLCDDGSPAGEGAPCDGGAGMCCLAVCQAGFTCCTDDDCDDANACTLDTCDSGSCLNGCGDPGCFLLAALTPVAVGGVSQLELQACRADLDPALIHCASTRNHEGLLGWNDFEAAIPPWSYNGGDLGLSSAAQNPSSAGDQGVAWCGDEAWVAMNFDLSGRQDVAVRFSMANADTDGNEMGAADYRACGTCEWRSLALVGDDQSQPYRDFLLLLPPDAQGSPNVLVSFFASNLSSGSDCMYLDDVGLIDLLPHTVAATLLDEGFEQDYGVFAVTDGDGDDVARVDDNGGQAVQIDDHKNACITAQLDTTAVDRRDLLVVHFKWRDAPNDPMDNGDYGYLELSTDAGTSWGQLSGIGHTFRPSSFVPYTAILPCEAYGLADLRLRFIAPSTAGNTNGEGIRVDDVVVEVWAMDWIDEFGAFTNAGGGRYLGSVRSDAAGTASVYCTYGCGASALQSNVANIVFQ